MQAGDRQALDQLDQGDNHGRGAVRCDDGFSDALIVLGLVPKVVLLVEQLLDDAGQVVRQKRADPGAWVLAREVPAQLDQLHQGRAIPFSRIRQRFQDQRQFFLGIVDQRGQGAFLCGGQSLSEDFVDPAFDRAGAILQHVAKGLVLAVNIGHEMFGALGQAQLRGQIDNRGRGGPDRGILFGQKLEIVEVKVVHIHIPHPRGPSTCGSAQVLEIQD